MRRYLRTPFLAVVRLQEEKRGAGDSNAGPGRRLAPDRCGRWLGGS